MPKNNNINRIFVLGCSHHTKGNSLFIYYKNISNYLKQIVDKNIYVVKEKSFILKEQKTFFLAFFFLGIYFIQHLLTIILFLFFKIKKKDILIVTSNSLFLFKIVVLLRNKKILIALDNFEVERISRKKEKNKIGHRIKKFFIFFGLHYAYKQYDYIACISNYTRYTLLEFFPQISESKIINIDCFIDIEVFKKNIYTKPLYKDKFILYVGSEEDRKNFTTVLKTFQLLRKNFPNLKLYKVGKDIVSENRQVTLSTLRELGLQFGKEVILFEEIDTGFLVDIYNHAELLLFPSLKEGFGFPIVEAMACGCPVVTSNRPPMQDLVQDKDLVAHPEDVDALANICLKIMQNKSFKNFVSKELMQRSKNYSSGKVINRLYDLIQQL